jgi:hypothetical protein
MSGEVRAIARVKLPVVWTVGEGFGALRSMGWTITLQIGLVALTEIVVFLVATMVSIFAGGLSETADYESSTAEQASRNPEIIVTSIVTVAALLLSINLTLGVSRWVLFRERPPIESIYRWGRRQWRLLGTILLCLLIMLVIMVAPTALLGFVIYVGKPLFTSDDGAIGDVAQFIPLLGVLAAVFWCTGWMWLTTPLVANDEPANVIGRAWRLSRGNRLRSIAIVLLIIIAVTIAQGILVALLKLAAGAVLTDGPQVTLLIKGFASLIASVIFQAWVAAAMAVGFTVLMGTHEGPVGGLPPQPA